MDQMTTNTAKQPQHSSELLKLENEAACKETIIARLLQNKPKTHLQTFKTPSSNALQSVKEFLPKLQSENERLGGEDLNKIDIENVEDSEGPIIEMSLSLFELEESGSDSEDDISTTDEDETRPQLIEEK